MTPVERFRELLSVPTVSRADPAEVDDDAFGLFRATLERLYPLTHAHLEREVVAGHSLLYRWRGASPEAPLLLLAHQDVVPVDGQSWRHDPFAADVEGEGADATIHARGAIDDKGALVAVFEAVEEALAEGVVPRTDVWLAFGHDEETRGTGARAMARILAERGVRPALVLDEGGAVVDGAVPGVAAPTAMIGVAERGVATFDLVTREAGGHASTPPPMPATARLARAVDRLRRRRSRVVSLLPCTRCSRPPPPTSPSRWPRRSAARGSRRPCSPPCCRPSAPRPTPSCARPPWSRGWRARRVTTCSPPRAGERQRATAHR